MKKISLFPFLLLCLVAGFALVVLADETLFEDINASGYIKGGSGVLFSPAATTGTSTNNAVIQIHGATTGLWNSASSAGFYRFGRLGIQESVGNVLMGDTNIMNTTIQSYTLMFPKAVSDLTEIRGQVGAELKLSIGLNRTAGFTTNTFSIGIDGTEWISANKGRNLIEINGRNGNVDNSLLITNFGSLVNMGDLTSSNFQQRVGSAGGFVGNGSGLTNLPGSAIAGFTPGSVIFAGASGQLSQNNAAFFWNDSQRRLGLGATAPTAMLDITVTNGEMNSFRINAYSGSLTNDSADLIMYKAMGTFASPTAVLSNANLGTISMRGRGTSSDSVNGKIRIQGQASQDWTDTAQGSRLVFFTTPNSSTNTVETMRIHNDGSVGILTNTIVPATQLYVKGSIGASVSVYAAGAPLISATNTFIGVSVGGVTGDLGAIYCTNVVADFPSTLTLAGADLTFPVPATCLTNMVVAIGRPSTEISGLVTTGIMSNNGLVMIRSRNATAGTIDQGAVPYTIQIYKVPTLNTLP